MKNQKGVTLIALTLTIIIFTMVLATITFSSISSLQLRRLNNMYADINVIQGRLDNYYIKNKGKLPIYSDTEVLNNTALQLVQNQFNIIMYNIGKDSSEPDNVTKRKADVRKNPNDSLPEVDNSQNPQICTNPTYKIIKFIDRDPSDSTKTINLLGSFTLNNYYQDATGVKDYYLVNLQSHQVYYFAGVQASEDEQDIRYSIPFEAEVYTNISQPLKEITGK